MMNYADEGKGRIGRCKQSDTVFGLVPDGDGPLALDFTCEVL